VAKRVSALIAAAKLRTELGQFNCAFQALPAFLK
jgi:hypothetical protein